MVSPFRRMAQRGALNTHLRGEATERWPKPTTFMIRWAQEPGHGSWYRDLIQHSLILGVFVSAPEPFW